MQVLSSALLTALVLVLASCYEYEPDVTGCVYTCGPSNSCPQGTTCDTTDMYMTPSGPVAYCKIPGEACAPVLPGCDASPLNAAGCPCASVGDTQACYIGDNGPKSRCSAGGLVTCQAGHVWGTCEGATGPAQEICFADDLDSDCDGNPSNGCTCDSGGNLCFDATGNEYTAQDLLVFVPNPVQVNAMFDIYVLSKSPGGLPRPSLQTASGYCAGLTSTACTLGGACASWSAARFTMVASGSAFPSTGNILVTVHVNDTGGGPCVTFSRDITGIIEIVP